MAKKKQANVDVHTYDGLEDLEISVDQIDDRLYLGNLSTARDYPTLMQLHITHVLTIDLVPLPQTILAHKDIHFKFIKLADIPKEDLITQLPTTNEYLKTAIEQGGVVLVHCVFGVSRSAAVVTAFIMEKYGLCYDEAIALVRTKRHFVHPNIGFEAQLKLFGHMGFKLNRDDPRFKQYRLKMAGQKLKQVKILPQLYADLIKPDPGLVRERPDPSVYRCRKCRRIVAGQTNIIPHVPKQVKIELVKKAQRPPPSQLSELSSADNGLILMEKLQKLASGLLDGSGGGSGCSHEGGCSSKPHTEEGTSRALEEYGYSETNIAAAIVERADSPEVCRLMWFVEPMVWMRDVTRETHGKLHCPKCGTKCGSFNWLMGCKCPCGTKVAPAFYLVPSKVEWSNIVQNVQLTV